MEIYNTLSRTKEAFKTIHPNLVKMYTCGQTTYNHIHMGNARFYVVFDAIRRYLEHMGYTVEFVQNFTDIDDKIIEKANQEGTTATAIAEKYIASTLADLQALNVKPATVNPRVTHEMADIIDMIHQLVNSGNAYEVGGTVYYNVKTFLDYGKLSRKKLDELEFGARVEVEQGKANPEDFVLWKPAKANEPSWESPWGHGRPGWHIECSAMIRKYLGNEIDIHGGAADLIFPHHENEIAQSEAATGENLARYWMHCGVLTVDHKKMSKSRGNFSTLADVTDKYPHDVIRFYFLSGHYRMPLEFTNASMEAAAQGLTRIKTCYKNLAHALKNGVGEGYDPTYENAFAKSMEDDFNTADAISAIFEMVRHINGALAQSQIPGQAYLDKMAALMNILGIDIVPPEDNSNDDEINALIAQRQAARKNKDFAESDRIRDQLTAMGIVLEDTREGVRWHRG